MRHRLFIPVVGGACLALASSTAHAVYTVQRILGGLNQPTYLTQAPGDNVDLFVVQRKDAAQAVGSILKYNRLTNTSSMFLDVGGTFSNDGGLVSMAFHPDFASNGLFYVASFADLTTRIQEYKLISGTPTSQRTILQYTNLAAQHVIDWIGFQPGGDHNHLFATTGDGGIQADQAGFVNNGQNPNTDMGKVLRMNIDPLATDAYPADASKNFAIPPTNPFVSDNTGKMKEILETGHRNPWRASFDRATGDLYVGDVGFNTKEEIDFNKNDASFSSGRDYGWAQREGTIATPVSGVGGPQGSSLNPIYEIGHSTFLSLTGGYVYHGPISELAGKYIFGDFNNSKIRSLNFDRNTDSASFNGSTAGITNVVDMTTTVNSKIGGGAGPINLPVSFGEDNAGNLYIVDFANAGAGGPWWDPTLGTGEIYAILPLAADANTDGKVNISDLLAMARHWHQPGDFNGGDFNFDGFVDGADLTVLASHWGFGMGAGAGGLDGLNSELAALGLPDAVVPEPLGLSTTIVFMLLSTSPLLRRRQPRHQQVHDQHR